MKVSGNAISKIYHEQIQKAKTEGSGDAFKKVMKDVTPQETTSAKKTAFHPPSGVDLTNPAFSGKPVKEADPVETMKYAAEVVAAEPNIREEKIARIQMMIKDGQYNISPEVVAERMIGSPIGQRHLFTSWEA